MIIDIKISRSDDLYAWTANCQALDVSACGSSIVETIQKLAAELSISFIYNLRAFEEKVVFDKQVYHFLEENPDVLKIALTGVSKLYEFFGAHIKSIHADIFGEELILFAGLTSIEEEKASYIFNAFDEYWWDANKSLVSGRLDFDIELLF